jgi:hypothetical protein
MRGALLASALVIGAVLLGEPACAHVVYGTATFFQLVRESDLVLRARVTDANGVWTLDDPPLRRSVVTITALETLKGPQQSGSLTFVPQGHGAAEYADGEEVVVFLQRIERSRELAGTAAAAQQRWISRQESGDRLVLDVGRDAFLAALRAYVAVDALHGEARLEGLRRVTFKLLASREPRLAASAVRDLTLAGDPPLVGAGDGRARAPLTTTGSRSVPASGSSPSSSGVGWWRVRRTGHG